MAQGLSGKHEVDARVWHKVCLELCDINVEGTIKAQRGCKGGDDLRQETVQVGVSGPLNVQVAATDVVQSLIIVHDGDIGVLQEGVNAEDRVVRFDHGRCDLWASPDCEAQLGLLAIVHRKTFQHEAAKSTARAATNGIVNHETLQPGAVVCKLADPVEDQVHDFFPNGVVSARKVICCILFTGDQLLGMEQLTVGSCAHFINNGWFKIHHHASWHMFSGSGFTEERVKCVITTTDGLITGHLSIRLNAVLKAKELPARITDLDATLAEVKAEDLTHVCRDEKEERSSKGLGRAPKAKA